MSGEPSRTTEREADSQTTDTVSSKDVSLSFDEEDDSGQGESSMPSATSTAFQSGALRNPTCSLCRNHGDLRKLKGHKKYCPRKDCECELCARTNVKRKINAAQVALKRACQADEQRENELMKENTAQAVSSTSSSQKTSTTEAKPEAKCSTVSKKPLPTAWTGIGPIAYAQQLNGIANLLGQSISFFNESLKDPVTRNYVAPELATCFRQKIVESEQVAQEALAQLNAAEEKLKELVGYSGERLPQTSPFPHRTGDLPQHFRQFAYTPYVIADRPSVITSVRGSPPVTIMHPGFLFHPYNPADPITRRH